MVASVYVDMVIKLHKCLTIQILAQLLSTIYFKKDLKIISMLLNIDTWTDKGGR